MANFLMPRLSDSMEEGTVLTWLVESGTSVSQGQEIVEIETDKATMACQAEDDGPLTILVAEGETRPVGEILATIGGNGGPPTTPAALPEATTTASVPDAPAESEPSPDDAVAPTQAIDDESQVRQVVSPLARRLASQHEIDLSSLTGSGRGGRILKADVLAAISATDAAERATSQALVVESPRPEAAGAKGAAVVEPLSRLRQIVAQRMAESRSTVPDFTLACDIDMGAALALRAEVKAAVGERRPSPSFNDMVVKACALALRDFPRLNGAYKEGAVEIYERVNVGVAVAAKEGLIVPTVFDADRRSLAEIAALTRALSERVRNSEITPPELTGSTFTVSNLGMFGIREFTAVINAPNAAILAVGAIEERAVIREGALTGRHMMSVTLSCDHRVIDGAGAAPLLVRIKELLESPLTLLY